MGFLPKQEIPGSKMRLKLGGSGAQDCFQLADLLASKQAVSGAAEPRPFSMSLLVESQELILLRFCTLQNPKLLLADSTWPIFKTCLACAPLAALECGWR